jgi:hypothetical protein
LAGKATEVAGRATAGTGAAIYKTAITPTVQEAERILASKAKTPFLTRVSDVLSGAPKQEKNILRSDTALEKGLIGRETEIGVQAKRANEALWKDKIAPAVKESKARVSKESMFSLAEKRVSKILEPGKKKAYEEALEALREDYKDVVDFSLEDAQQIKRELDQFTPEKIFKGKNVANEAAVLRNDLADAIRQQTYDALEDVNIKKDYLDWANLKELEKIGVKAISEGGKKGGFGGFWTSLYDAGTTPVKTIGGQVLYRVGNKLEFIGKKGIKKFGDYLKTKGISKP